MLPSRKDRREGGSLDARVADLEDRIGELQAEKTRLQEEVSYLSEDPDFGVLTRKAFLQISRLFPRGVWIFAFLDFDRIKEFNESLGYLEVNRRIRATLSAVRQKRDLPVRWFSGDELVILFDGKVGVARRRMHTYARIARAHGLSFTWALGTWVARAETLEKAVDRVAWRVGRGKHRNSRGPRQRSGRPV